MGKGSISGMRLGAANRLSLTYAALAASMIFALVVYDTFENRR